MGRVVDVDDLVSTWEITERLGYTNPISFSSVRLRDDTFPDPVLRFGKNDKYSLWLWPEVLAWAYRTGRVATSIGRPMAGR